MTLYMVSCCDTVGVANGCAISSLQFLCYKISMLLKLSIVGAELETDRFKSLEIKN